MRAWRRSWEWRPTTSPTSAQYVEHPAGTDKLLWFWALIGFCHAYGWQVTYTEDSAPAGWSMVAGRSPRGHMHVVVAYDGVMVHDPHPSGDGLVDAEEWFSFDQMEGGSGGA